MRAEPRDSLAGENEVERLFERADGPVLGSN